MPSVEDTADPARALRAHLAAHNLRVAVISLLTLVAAVALWLALHAVTRWLTLLLLTAIKGTDAQMPAAVEAVFWSGATALLAVAWIDRRLRRDDRPKDHKSAAEIASEFILAIPRVTLAVWGTLSAWQRLTESEIADAVALIERLTHEHRIRLSSMPLEIPDSARRFKILFALQLVQVIDIRREDRELWVTLNPLRPPALTSGGARDSRAGLGDPPRLAENATTDANPRAR